MLSALNKYRDREDGFTLIELLIVVLIIGILAAIAIPVYLGLQAGGHKSAVRSDVNIKVKVIQVALTEGSTVSAQLGTTNGTEKGESLIVQKSTTTGASANDFMVIGTESTSATPAAQINYAYTYDSVTGNFSEANSAYVANAPVGTLLASCTFEDSVGNRNLCVNDANGGYTGSAYITATSPSGSISYGGSSTASQARTGSGSFYLESGNNNPGVQAVLSGGNIVLGGVYRADFYLRGTTATFTPAAANTFSSSGASNITLTEGATDANGWRQLSITWTATNAYSSYVAALSGLNPNPTRIYVDDAAIYRVS